MPVPKCMLVFLTGEAYRRLRSNHTLNFFQTCWYRMIQVLRSTRKYESVVPAGCLISSYGAFVVLGSQHFTFCCVLVLFYFIINSFIFIIRHYSRLSVSIRFYLSLLATTDSSLFATVRHYSRLFGRYSGFISSRS